MRFLADENIPLRTVEVLRKQGHDVLWARTDCPGIKDRALLDRAEADGRLILTLDKDFWQLTLQRPNISVATLRWHRDDRSRWALGVCRIFPEFTATPRLKKVNTRKRLPSSFGPLDKCPC
jgi:hypothetical protein